MEEGRVNNWVKGISTDRPLPIFFKQKLNFYCLAVRILVYWLSAHSLANSLLELGETL